MTGYANASRDTAAGTLTIEIRSVNSRFLDLQFRINDELRVLEPLLREAITGNIHRGKVECRLSYARPSGTGALHALNNETLAYLASIQTEVRRHFPEAQAMSVNELLRWPGVVEEASLSQETLQSETQSLMAAALQAFLDTRRREGAAMQAMLLSHIGEMEAIVERITPLIPQAVAQFQQKATERLKEALGLAAQNGAGAPSSSGISRDDAMERIRQEVTLYGIRVDIAEELVRLNAHLAETRHILKKGGQVGKRLDFMMQELNREANTIGSKAAVKELSDASMAMKLLIEQMREQVQNLE